MGKTLLPLLSASVRLVPLIGLQLNPLRSRVLLPNQVEVALTREGAT